MTLAVSTEHNNYLLNATVAFADTGPENSRIRLYDAADTLLVTLVLAKPCGEVLADALVLDQEDPAGDLITAQGSVVTGVWLNGEDTVVATGTVSDEAGSGDFKVTGTTGTLLYAGGRAILGVTALT
ncbi:MAG: hypothetical protein ACTS8S_00395 [Giesbergeria sp.]